MVVEGFERLDDNILDKRPPKIKWLHGFDNKEDSIKINYLKKLASTMNHAARLIQDERDELVRLMVLKEKQMEVMAAQVRRNDEVLMKQVTKMNEQRQGFIEEFTKQSKRVKELEAELSELSELKDKE